MAGAPHGHRTPLQRYLFAQVPGWAIVAVGAAVASSAGADAKLAWGIAAGWVVKDLIVYPLVRRAYERGRSGAEALVGTVCTVREVLAPSGWVAVRGELWRAEVDARSAPVPAGREVRVQSVDGLTLHVVAVADVRT